MTALQEQNGETALPERIGIMGGTFNPIHNGHINMAREFLKRLKLDRLIFIPDKTPPHKSAGEVISAADRLEMCRLAVSGGRFDVSDIEIARGGTSYTVDTLHELEKIYPGAQLFLITGADMFLTLDKWRNFPEISRIAHLCACPRKEGQLAALQKQKEKLEGQYGSRCHIENIPVIEVSSTEIRRRLKNGESVSGLIPEQVYNYIIRNNLYQNTQRSENDGRKSY